MKRFICIIFLFFITISANAQYLSASYGWMETFNGELGVEFQTSEAQIKTYIGYQQSDEFGNFINLGIGAEKVVYSKDKTQLVTLLDAKLVTGDTNLNLNNDDFVFTGVGELFAGLRMPYEILDLYFLSGVKATPYEGDNGRGGNYYVVPLSIKINLN